MPLPVISADKANHFFYGSATSVAVFFCAVPFLPVAAAGAVALGGAFVVGVAKEVYDYRTSGAVSEPLDAVWTAAGGVPVLVAAGLPAVLGA